MTYSVLLVEDDKMVQAINQEYVNRTSNYQVKAVAETVDEALSFLASESFDLVLIDDDLGANQRQGGELIQEIRQNKIPCQMIMLTAQDLIPLVQDALNYGVHDYILKPFTYQRLEESLTALSGKLALLKQNTSLDQKSLDLLYGGKPSLLTSSDRRQHQLLEGPLEKGITSATLECVFDAIQAAPDQFTITDLTHLTQISHVTIRKYIHFLTQNKYLLTHQEYGNTGRPAIYYSLTNK